VDGRSLCRVSAIHLLFLIQRRGFAVHGAASGVVHVVMVNEKSRFLNAHDLTTR
jgi:hypothetical protein